MSDLRSRSLFFLLTMICSSLYSEIIIQDIIFEGNELITDQVLINSIQSGVGEKFDQSVLIEDVNRIQEIYKNKNFFNFNIKQPEIKILQNEKVIILFPIIEFGKFTIDSLSISGCNYIGLNKINSYITGKNILLSDLPGILMDLVDYYNSNGFFFYRSQP